MLPSRYVDCGKRRGGVAGNEKAGLPSVLSQTGQAGHVGRDTASLITHKPRVKVASVKAVSKLEVRGMFFVNVSLTVFKAEHDWYGTCQAIVPSEDPIEAQAVLRQAIHVLIDEACGVVDSCRDEVDLLAEVSPCTAAEAKLHQCVIASGPITSLKGQWEQMSKMACIAGRPTL